MDFVNIIIIIIIISYFLERCNVTTKWQANRYTHSQICVPVEASFVFSIVPVLKISHRLCTQNFLWSTPVFRNSMWSTFYFPFFVLSLGSRRYRIWDHNLFNNELLFWRERLVIWLKSPANFYTLLSNSRAYALLKMLCLELPFFLPE